MLFADMKMAVMPSLGRITCWQNLWWIPILVVQALIIPSVQGQSLLYNFTGCSSAVHRVYGASITSQFETYYTEPNLECTATFKLPWAQDTSQRFELRLLQLDLAPPVDGNCMDSIAAWQRTGSTTNKSLKQLFGPVCGSLGSGNMKTILYSDPGAEVQLIWRTGSTDTGTYRGFHIILTALTSSLPSGCSWTNMTQCVTVPGCISSSLLCDTVRNCADGTDELNCTTFIHSDPFSRHGALVLDPQLYISMTTNGSSPRPLIIPPISTKKPDNLEPPESGFLDKSLFLWLPLFVVVLFTVIMVIFIICIRRDTRQQNRQQAWRSNSVDKSNNSTYTVFSLTAKTTTPGGSDGDDKELFQEVDMVSIIVVGVLFVVILMICVILACRSKGGELDVLTEESNQLRLDVSSNPGYSEGEGLPSTPPPTYSMIERQMSYVSQISMSSSQVSEPPDYDEALEIDSFGNPIPRRNSSRTSNASGRLMSNRTGGQAVRSASGYARTRPRVHRYARSHSATEDGHRPSYMSQASTISEVGPIDEDTVGDNDDTFTAPASETSPDAPMGISSQPHHPITSTPHVLESGYNIEMLREDSMAPLFRLNDTPDSSEPSTSEANSRMLRDSNDSSSVVKSLHKQVDDSDDDGDHGGRNGDS